MDVETFVLHRFNGDEIFRVKSATMKAFDGEGVVKLFLYIDTKERAIQLLPDTEELGTRPNAEVYITLKKLDAAKIVGRRFSVPMAYNKDEDEYDACIYYCDHQDLNKNVVRVLEGTGTNS